MNTINKTLPNHLIFEKILPKLPVKSLLRFKSVSKSWLSTISSPEFAKSHLQLFSSPPKLIVLAGQNRATGGEFYLLNYDENNNNYELNHFVELELEDVCDSPVKSFYILGSCNGLVSLHVQQQSSDEGAFFIGNPATRRYRKIMIPEGLYVSSAHCFVFYYESSTDDYKIFGGFSSFEGDYVEFYVFSLSTGNWRQINSLDIRVVPDEIEEVEEVVLVNETVYMLLEFRDSIIGFDLSTEQMKELPRMDWLNNYRFFGLSELGGCLLLRCTTANLKLDDVWMLKDTSDVTSLEKLFSVNHTNVRYYAFSETGKCLIHTEGKLRVFDPTRETPQMSQGGIAFDNGDSIVQSKSYIESLISPF